MAAFGPETLLSLLTAEERRSQLIVAFSGGADSLALLHACVRSGLHVEAAHVDHRLHPDSPRWARHCAGVAASLGVELHTLEVDVELIGEGVEAAARHARYAALRERLPAGACLLTAHHADDQAETVLLRALRGTGPYGLAAMVRRQPFGRGVLLRPLLELRRDDLRAYARDSGFGWIDDPANRDHRHDRSWLRHHILPPVTERWPRAVPALNRLARQAADLREGLDWLLDAHLDAPGEPLPQARLERLPESLRPALFRRWLQREGVQPPGERRLRQGLSDLLTARADAEPQLAWPAGQVRRFRGRLYVLPLELPGALQSVLTVTPGEPLAIASYGRLDWLAMNGGMNPRLGPYQLRGRQGGERILCGGRHRRVKELLRTRALPPWERDTLPILVRDGEPVAVPGVTVADGVLVGPGQSGIMPMWTPAWRLG
jgi:tRNA(Ile)-lysidine synthase